MAYSSVLYRLSNFPLIEIPGWSSAQTRMFRGFLSYPMAVLGRVSYDSLGIPSARAAIPGASFSGFTYNCFSLRGAPLTLVLFLYGHDFISQPLWCCYMTSTLTTVFKAMKGIFNLFELPGVLEYQFRENHIAF
jgi:hypothetical protein